MEAGANEGRLSGGSTGPSRKLIFATKARVGGAGGEHVAVSRPQAPRALCRVATPRFRTT
jgi:hypothetical protein